MINERASAARFAFLGQASYRMGIELSHYLRSFCFPGIDSRVMNARKEWILAAGAMQTA